MTMGPSPRIDVLDLGGGQPLGNITVIMGACGYGRSGLPATSIACSIGRSFDYSLDWADGLGLEPKSSKVGGRPVEVPQGRSVPGWIVGFGQIGVDVFHCRFELIHGIPELHQVGPRHENVVLSEAVGGGQMPRFECSLPMTAPAVHLGATWAFRGPKCCPAPKAPANGG